MTGAFLGIFYAFGVIAWAGAWLWVWRKDERFDRENGFKPERESKTWKVALLAAGLLWLPILTCAFVALAVTRLVFAVEDRRHVERRWRR